MLATSILLPALVLVVLHMQQAGRLMSAEMLEEACPQTQLQLVEVQLAVQPA
jgi:hypothetical protein